jgi:serine/threonine-protein phosphatase 2B catalytic subunit
MSEQQQAAVAAVGGASGGGRRTHSRTPSLGTTSTSPSTRRRSLENTVELLRNTLEGKNDSVRLEK